MININNPNQSVCDSCGFAYDTRWVKEIEIKTDHFEPDEYYLKPVSIKIHLCINCIRDIRKQSNKTLLKHMKDYREYKNVCLKPTRKMMIK